MRSPPVGPFRQRVPVPVADAGAGVLAWGRAHDRCRQRAYARAPLHWRGVTRCARGVRRSPAGLRHFRLGRAANGARRFGPGSVSRHRGPAARTARSVADLRRGGARVGAGDRVAGDKGICVELSPILRRPEDLQIASPLLLDLTEDAVISRIGTVSWPRRSRICAAACAGSARGGSGRIRAGTGT